MHVNRETQHDSWLRPVARPVVAACAFGLALVFVVPRLGAVQADAEKAVLQARAQAGEAFQRGDVKAYRALTTDDFVRVTSTGLMFSRAEWLKRVVPVTGPPRRPGSFDEASIRIYGDAALVTVRNKPVQPDGSPGPVGLFTHRDLAAWERLSAPDHLIIGTDGSKVTRAERVAALKAPPAANAAPPAAESELRLMVKGGSLAVVSWKAGLGRSLKVLAKRGTAWQQVLQQRTPIVAPRS